MLHCCSLFIFDVWHSRSSLGCTARRPVSAPFGEVVWQLQHLRLHLQTTLGAHPAFLWLGSVVCAALAPEFCISVRPNGSPASTISMCVAVCVCVVFFQLAFPPSHMGSCLLASRPGRPGNAQCFSHATCSLLGPLD